MVTAFRAAVMLAALVGLPAAWVYYGPLPPAAMGVIERSVATAKQSLGWADQAPATRWTVDTPKAAPRFDAAIVQASHLQHEQAIVERAVKPLPPVIHDPQFALASATMPADGQRSEADMPAQVDAELASQLEPHLSLLRSLDAAEYTLENWGGGGELYRFRCAVALGENDDHTRQFEAVHADPLRAVHQVVGEVTSWQNARRLGAPPRWH